MYMAVNSTFGKYLSIGQVFQISWNCFGQIFDLGTNSFRRLSTISVYSISNRCFLRRVEFDVNAIWNQCFSACVCVRVCVCVCV